MYRRSRFRFIATWLALLSVAMLFIAPVISKTLAHRTACQQSVSATKTHHDVPMTMPEMHHSMVKPGHCQPHHEMPHLMMPGQAMSPMEEIACGYCQLLIHMPFVQLMLTVLLVLMLLCIRKTSPLRVNFSPIFRVWAPQRARAPPAVFLSLV
ncbi:DUF2946 domain-containing protein [Klebsiella michiganensis]|uniref:DUF2946 domain-containing protein n=1 Tax=Klebsiella TaxID=570 RepID=UPI000DF0D6F7|nr:MULTISPECIES: DUF2946 domain-containing protein [Klebsiella]MEB6370927.1 DUF2946 domain-containing protein [Klebsiella michiganensis]UXO79617.1 DUF2946 domain-containing protein [Klebsiella michiganensis]HBZ7326272.1 DUF2946 domain-containing protein [Klebsiella pneumoniae]HBZ7351977.1 DUF2946 domain-containing protein [Klebsiella pneumoniae]HBZ7938450.1 DUF2946 domain-containing protein [Klebsiella pneumoniae]